jgi:CubicO group peptidase (beta-lactamase class C family)
MVRFYQMVLNGGELDGRRILSQAAVGQMTRVQTDNLTTGFTDGNGWGLGWCIVRNPQGITQMLSPARTATAEHLVRRAGSIRSAR